MRSSRRGRTPGRRGSGDLAVGARPAPRAAALVVGPFAVVGVALGPELPPAAVPPAVLELALVHLAPRQREGSRAAHGAPHPAAAVHGAGQPFQLALAVHALVLPVPGIHAALEEKFKVNQQQTSRNKRSGPCVLQDLVVQMDHYLESGRLALVHSPSACPCSRLSLRLRPLAERIPRFQRLIALGIVGREPSRSLYSFVLWVPLVHFGTQGPAQWHLTAVTFFDGLSD